MKTFKTILFALVISFTAISANAQVSDDIQINATFSSAIDLTVTSGSSIDFNVSSLKEYTNGLADASAYNADFEVNSSVDFKVDLTSTAFSDGSGNTINAGNFGYTIADNGTYAVGTNHKLLGGTSSPSAYAILGSDEEIVTSSDDGNAGSAAANAFTLKFELGTSDVRAVSGLSNLLDQNIAPAKYSSVVTLTASAMP